LHCNCSVTGDQKLDLSKNVLDRIVPMKNPQN
jgi:hypothetical protein